MLGYSAWPGWFPLAVAEEAGIFEEHGLDVELKFFADYLGSLDAMAGGQLDGNTQTLNDTMFAVSAGSKQVIVVTNDNSTGNDAIICDESIGTIEELEGKTIGAEEGVVDHFLLCRASTPSASPRTTSSSAACSPTPPRPGSPRASSTAWACSLRSPSPPWSARARTSCSTARTSPGTISDHIVVTPELIEERPGDVQALVDAWYATLDYIEENPEESLAIMAELAGLTAEEYESFAEGTTIFSAEEALAAFAEGDDTTSLIFTANLINPFLVESGLTEEEAPLDGLFDPSFTAAYVEGGG